MLVLRCLSKIVFKTKKPTNKIIQIDGGNILAITKDIAVIFRMATNGDK